MNYNPSPGTQITEQETKMILKYKETLLLVVAKDCSNDVIKMMNTLFIINPTPTPTTKPTPTPTPGRCITENQTCLENCKNSNNATTCEQECNQSMDDCKAGT